MNSAEGRLECLYIFTLGTPSQGGAPHDASETSYYASRIGFSEVMRKAASFLAGHTAGEALKALSRGTSPVLVGLVSVIASRFERAVLQKVVAGAVPIIGAAGGAAINGAFTGHFNQAARYHFGLRRLEEQCDRDEVRRVFEEAGPKARTAK